MKVRTSLVPVVYVLCFSLFVGVLVLTAPPAASGIEAEAVDIYPETLNLKCNGTWITVLIGLPEGYEVSDINVTSVRLGTVPAVWGNVEEDKLVVKFDMQAVIDYIWVFKLHHVGIELLPKEGGVEVDLTITGELFDDGPPFEGSDTIRVIYSG